LLESVPGTNQYWAMRAKQEPLMGLELPKDTVRICSWNQPVLSNEGKTGTFDGA